MSDSAKIRPSRDSNPQPRSNNIGGPRATIAPKGQSFRAKYSVRKSKFGQKFFIWYCNATLKFAENSMATAKLYHVTKS
jgi:hypothetical protein